MTRPLVRGLFVLATFMLLAACAVPTKTEVAFEPGKAPLPARHEGIVLFPTYRVGHAYEDANFIRCLRREVAKQPQARALRLVDAAAFQDALFPWFEPKVAPKTVEELKALLERGPVRERIQSLGVRYLVNVVSATSTDGFPGMVCGAGYGGGGCLGVFTEDKTHRVNILIWDVVQGTTSGGLSTTTTGKSFGAALGIPILFLAYTEDDACRAMASELVRLLTGVSGQTTPGR